MDSQILSTKLPEDEKFIVAYRRLNERMRLRGFQPKTVNSYAREFCRCWNYFAGQIEEATEDDWSRYFVLLQDKGSWTMVKHARYGLAFYFEYILKRSWPFPELVKPPKVSRLPDIVSCDEFKQILLHTRVLSYRVFLFTLYSLGLRLGEGLNLKVSDIDAERKRVHIRDAKFNRDRFVPLPESLLDVLRMYWCWHRNPVLIFPNRATVLAGAGTAKTPMDRGSVQKAMKIIVEQYNIKKNYSTFVTP